MVNRVQDSASLAARKLGACARLAWSGIALGLTPLVLLASDTATAAEIDSITPRQIELREASRSLDSWVDGLLQEGVRRANELGAGCDEEIFLQQLRWAISFPFIGHLIAEGLNEHAEIERARVPFDESVYRDLSLFDAISVHLKDLSAVVRMNGHLVGVDKLGHFFVQGWTYFDIAYRQGKGIRAAMESGERSERTYFGLYTTGIYSYADLSANFEGMRFWLRVLGTERDPLDKGYFFNRPYVSCARRVLWFGERRWRVKRHVRLADYVTAAWDEGSNCSRYGSQDIEKLVIARVRERELHDGVDYDCPLEPDACVQARERYGAYAARLLHPECASAEPERRRWWALW